MALLGPACMMTIDESRIPCDTCGGPDAAAADAAPAKPDGGGSSGGVRCGTTSCSGAKPVCCVVNLGENDYRNGACDTAVDCPTGDFFHCTQPSECASGTSCCVVMKGGAFTRTECAATCAGTMLCDPNGPPCTNGTTCTSSDVLPGLYECR